MINTHAAKDKYFEINIDNHEFITLCFYYQLRHLMQNPKRFPFYKHLITQECRKDIILENDFTNIRTRDRNTPFFTKYKEKITKNKMRIAYLAGFSFLFSLNYFYDAFFQSPLYVGLVDRSQRLLMRLDSSSKHINYDHKLAAELGGYFQRLDYSNSDRQITPSLLSARVPAFLECPLEALDVNSFVVFCLEHKIAPQQLPPPSRL